SEYSGTSIQWQSSTTNSGEASWSDITAATTTTYNTPTLYAGNITVTTYYRAKINSTCGNVISGVSKISVNDTYTWTGNVNTDWSNPGNWTCNTVPTLTTTVIIPSAPVNQPHVLPNTNIARAKTITVEDGASVTVNTAGRLRVADNIDVATSATFLVENNASLVQINNVIANTGIITVKRNSNALFKLDYTLWSSPVASQNFGTFSSATLTNRFYEYRYGFDAVNGNTYREQYWTVPSTGSFVAGRGFLIRMPDVVPGLTGYAEITATHTFEGNFTGAPNNGNVQPSLTLGAANDNQAGRFYAVGNPYPSPISVVDFYTDTDNAARIKSGSALYFWRKKNNNPVSSYATLTLSGLVSNNGTPGFGGETNADFYPTNTEANPNNVAGWIISPGQGFLVRLAAGVTQNVVFKNSMRRNATAATATPAGQPFFKTTQSSAPSRYWLNLTDATGIYSQALVAYSQEGTLDVDYGYDGFELAQGSVRLYSKQGEDNFTIQARPDFTAADVVKVGYAITTAGQYTLKLDQLDGVFEGSQDIYLKDNQLGTTYDLKGGDYVFTTDAGTFGDRFEVVYVNNTLDVTSPEYALNNVLVYKANGSSTINVTSGSLEMSNVTVYDIRGRQIYNKAVSGTQASIADLNIAQQVIIVEVTTTAGKVSKKVIF
ncbi:MAG: T9SS sorting signal type C domain-containing protein, partial [Bacteroidota bacterium]